MALSLSPHQIIHTSSLSIPPQSYSTTPRPFTTIVHGSSRPDHEILSMDQTPPLLGSGFEDVTHTEEKNKLASSSQRGDLPSWTPLRTLENDEDLSSDQEVDELATSKMADFKLPMKQQRTPTSNTRETVEVTMPAGQTLKPLSDAQLPKRKKARFDGVLIARKPPYRRTFHNSQAKPRRGTTSTTTAFSLVDALARTFDANKHTEDPLRRQRPPASSLRRYIDTPAGPQTDTEAEEELQLNSRLATSLKRRRLRPNIIPVSANISETTSEDAAFLGHDVLHTERSIKRLKAIQYEANSALIDRALGTVQALICWDGEMDIITRDEDYVVPVTARVASTTVPVADNSEGGTVPVPAAPPTGNAQSTPAPFRPPLLTPYQSRGVKFKTRLNASFGPDATVRTDRVARPRPADLELFAMPDEPDSERATSPSASDSTESLVRSVSASTVPEGGASAVPSTHVTSQSPDIPAVEPAVAQLPDKALDEANAPATLAFGAQEEQIEIWITALQRLIKGKVRVNEEDLETLSIILAEIESVKDGLDQSASVTSELRETVNQLSDLQEIPFGDRNKLRRRAAHIFLTWPSVKPGAF